MINKAQSNIMSALRPFSSKVTVFSRLLTTLPMSLCQALHQPRIRLLATSGPNRTERDQKHPVSYKKWLNNIVSKLTKSQNEPISEKNKRFWKLYIVTTAWFSSFIFPDSNSTPILVATTTFWSRLRKRKNKIERAHYDERRVFRRIRSYTEIWYGAYQYGMFSRYRSAASVAASLILILSK